VEQGLPLVTDQPSLETRTGRRIVRLAHALIARGPRWLAKAYIVLLSLVSRNLLSLANQHRVRNVMFGHSWPAMEFGPRAIVLGGDVGVRLVPHIGEFDEQALYMRELDYEQAMFKWLARQAGAYDLIIEIGANVGIYTIFFDALRRKSLRPKQILAKTQVPAMTQVIISFEPSPEAYRRLQRNLKINGAEIISFQAAVGVQSGQQAFYEPIGHLTNGSFVRSFAELFAAAVDQTTVETVAAVDLEKWLATSAKALIKLDVEGFEPELLAALAPLLEKYHPDLLIEVMPSTVEPLEANPTLARYDRFLVTAKGPRPEQKFYFSQTYFDWFLTWPKEGAR
jgi:FkbM family methyltransferase